MGEEHCHQGGARNREEPAEVGPGASNIDDIGCPWMPSLGGVTGMPRTCWGDYVIRLAWERLGIHPEELGEVLGEKEVWVSLLRQPPPRPSPRKVEEMDGWMNHPHHHKLLDTSALLFIYVVSISFV